MWRQITLVAAAGMIVLGLASCGSTRSPATSGTPHSPSPTVRTTPSGSVTPSGSLMGRWQRVVTCQELVKALDKAGLRAVIPYAWSGQTSASGESSYAAGSPKPTMAHPCRGAIPRSHSHFFAPGGMFGSLDWEGGQVDNDSYRIVNDHTVRIGHATSITVSSAATPSCCLRCFRPR